MNSDRKLMDQFENFMANNIAMYLIGICHNDNLNKKDVLHAFKTSKEYGLVKGTLKKRPSLKGKRLYALTYSLYQKKMYRILYHVLRLEKKLKKHFSSVGDA